MFLVGMSTDLCLCKCNLDMNRTFNYITIPEGFNEKFLEHLEKKCVSLSTKIFLDFVCYYSCNISQQLIE